MKFVYLSLAAACWTVGACLFASCGTPWTVGVSSDYGSAQYSEKGGLVIDVDASAIERRLTEPPAVNPQK